MVLTNKKGSVTVFICIFFVTLVFMILTFAEVSRKIAVGSSSKALCSLWADSLLAEYDTNLQKRYNVFGFYGYPTDVKKKVEFYAGESFDAKKYIDYEVTGSSLYDYSLAHAGVLEEQLVDAGKLAFTEKFREPDGDIKAVTGYGGTVSDQKIFQDLPSEGTTGGFSVTSAATLLSGVTSLGDVVKKAGRNWWINQYIFAYFKDAADEKGLGETYLRNEIEYIICGGKSDTVNARKIRTRIVAMREVPNLLYLNKDPVKSAEAMAAAQLLTPGPAAIATKQAILAAWAYAESVNDYKLLINGHKVPVMKTGETWAVDLDSVLANQADGYIYTGVDVGESYQDYLRLFTYAMDAEVRTLRIMDLMQINMRKFYYEGFLLKEYNGGVHFVLTVNGVEHETVKTYTRPEE